MLKDALRVVRCHGVDARGGRCCSSRSAPRMRSPARTSRRSAACSRCGARTTRSATSPPVATRPWCSRQRRAAITYRVEVGVCLASGDPIGDPRAWPQAIDTWLRLCQSVRLGAGGHGRQFGGRRSVPGGGPQRATNSVTRRSCTPTEFRLSGASMRGSPPGGDPRAPRRADRAHPSAPRHSRRRDGESHCACR